MIKFRRLHNFCTPFLINLSICDAMMTALILPILGFNGITGYSYLPTILCKMVSIIFHVIIGKYVIRLYRNKSLMNNIFLTISNIEKFNSTFQLLHLVASPQLVSFGAQRYGQIINADYWSATKRVQHSFGLYLPLLYLHFTIAIGQMSDTYDLATYAASSVALIQ